MRRRRSCPGGEARRAQRGMWSCGTGTVRTKREEEVEERTRGRKSKDTIICQRISFKWKSMRRRGSCRGGEVRRAQRGMWSCGSGRNWFGKARPFPLNLSFEGSATPVIPKITLGCQMEHSFHRCPFRPPHPTMEHVRRRKEHKPEVPKNKGERLFRNAKSTRGTLPSLLGGGGGGFPSQPTRHGQTHSPRPLQQSSVQLVGTTADI